MKRGGRKRTERRERGRSERGRGKLAVIMFVEFKQTSAVSKLHPQLPVS